MLVRSIVEIGFGLAGLIGAVFTGVLVGFQALVGFTIRCRGALVTPALVAGVVFCVGAALVSSPGGEIANLVMTAAQAILAFTQ